MEEKKENFEDKKDLSEENLKKKSKNLQLLIEKYKKELDKVRTDCLHKEKKLKLIIDNNNTSASLRRVCTTCDKILGYPSNEETKTFYGEK